MIELNQKLIIAASLAASKDGTRPQIECVHVSAGNGIVEYRATNGRIAVRIREKKKTEEAGAACITPEAIKVMRALSPNSVAMDCHSSGSSVVIDGIVSIKCFDETKFKYPSFGTIVTDAPTSFSAFEQLMLDRDFFNTLLASLKKAIPRASGIQVTSHDGSLLSTVYIHSPRTGDVTFDAAIMPLRIG